MAKHVPLQMLMVTLTDGRRGLFIGVPLIEQHEAQHSTEVEEIWFSDVRELSNQLTLEQLLEMVREQNCRCGKRVN